jgi:hypothetical protein
VYGDGLWVAVADTQTNLLNYFMISPDAINWEQINLGPQGIPVRKWLGVTYGNGIFVAVAQNSGTDPPIIISRDGREWTAINVTTASLQQNWTAVAYGNGRFVAVSTGGSPAANIIMYSDDGINWTNATITNAYSPASLTPVPITSVGYRDGKWVACLQTNNQLPGPTQASERILLSLDNGVTWTFQVTPTNGLGAKTELYDVKYGNGQWLAVGRYPTAVPSPVPQILRSVDGVNWTNVAGTDFSNVSLGSIAYANGTWIAIEGNNTKTGAGSQSQTFRYSTDNGLTWIQGTMPFGVPKNWSAVAYGNGQFVAVANELATINLVARFGPQFVNDERAINDNVLQGRILYGGMNVVCYPNGIPPAPAPAPIPAINDLLGTPPYYYFTITNIPQYSGFSPNGSGIFPFGTVYADTSSGPTNTGVLRVQL